MIRLHRFLAAATAVAAFAPPARAQFGSLDGTSAALSVALPMGTFDRLARTGFGVSLRHGIGDPDAPWSGRGTFGFTYFKGNVTYDNIQFIETTFDIVHRSSDAFYQFGGLGLYNTRFTYANASGLGSQRADQNFGLSGGVGVNYTWGDTKTFLEFAATTVFTGSENSAWFPVRIGIRF
ncbi:MAG: hypothetical protein U9Q74_09905 [Gemmatimonadota bacterium]|nr:hypothetical protein [Gemmatimonadota bacterium]